MGRTFPAVGFPYIKVVLMDAANTSLSWSATDNRPDYFNSLTNDRYVNEANVAKIQIDYVPQADDPTGKKIEEAIVSSGGRCWYQYGMSGHQFLAYKGMIVNYTSQLNEGSINYTLDVVSQSVMSNSKFVQSEHCRIDPKSIGSYFTYNFSPSPTLNQWAWELYQIIMRRRSYGFEEFTMYYNTYPESFSDYYREKELRDKLGSTIVARVEALAVSGDASTDEALVFDCMEHIIGLYCPGYVFKREKCDRGFRIPSLGIRVPTIRGNARPPLYTLQYIAMALIDRADPSMNSYKLVVDDSLKNGAEEGWVYIKRTGQKIANSMSSLVYEFDWNNRDGDVLSWNPSYSGSYYIFANRARAGDDVSAATVGTYSSSWKVITDSSTGSVNVTGFKAPITRTSNGNQVNAYTSISPEVFSQLSVDFDEFAEGANYPYEATLEVLGVADQEIELAETPVKVKPWIRNEMHHSQGTYIVKGVTDTVNSNGFHTTLKLYRAVDPEDKIKIYGEGSECYYYDAQGQVHKGTYQEIQDLIAADRSKQPAGEFPSPN